MLEFVKVDQEADPYSIANTIALNALVARAKSKGELLAHLKKRGVEDDVANATIFRLQGVDPIPSHLQEVIEENHRWRTSH
jgi:SOS response regulatory protein OraA/RecX